MFGNINGRIKHGQFDGIAETGGVASIFQKSRPDLGTIGVVVHGPSVLGRVPQNNALLVDHRHTDLRTGDQSVAEDLNLIIVRESPDGNHIGGYVRHGHLPAQGFPVHPVSHDPDGDGEIKDHRQNQQYKYRYKKLLKERSTKHYSPFNR